MPTTRSSIVRSVTDAPMAVGVQAASTTARASTRKGAARDADRSRRGRSPASWIPRAVRRAWGSWMPSPLVTSVAWTDDATPAGIT
ncbi:hypothetical protein KIV56_01865 [Cryobacterium breve]|uniref:Uncharacterized protein n=1 Tax=Cryobacterium breve TaxID=1259258 RepID=A0ABY7NCS5_9MICO|nr:hypothetical protein KIV56_01865 [Cryobacterium breve]